MMDNKLYLKINMASIKWFSFCVKNRSNAFADIKKQMIKMNIEVFSDGSELWDDIASCKYK